MMSKYMVGYRGERERGRERFVPYIDRSEELKILKNKLMQEPCLPHGDMVLSRPGLLPRTLSGSDSLGQG